MLEIKFRYKDAYSRGDWSYQTCMCKSMSECIEWYGLGIDCEYEIISVKEI